MIVRVSTDGRITIPAAIRRTLGIVGGSKLELDVGDGALTLRRARTITDVAGIFRERVRLEAVDWDAARRTAREAVARQAVARQVAEE